MMSMTPAEMHADLERMCIEQANAQTPEERAESIRRESFAATVASRIHPPIGGAHPDYWRIRGIVREVLDEFEDMWAKERATAAS